MRPRERRKSQCPSGIKTTTSLLLSFLVFSAAPATAAQQAPASQKSLFPNFAVLPPNVPDPSLPDSGSAHDFTLRHIFHHGTYVDSRVHRKVDIHPENSGVEPKDGDAPISRKDHFKVRSRPVEIQRLTDRSPEALEAHRRVARLTGAPAVLDISAWTIDELPAPNITDKDTVVSIARMAANAYVQEPGKGEWEEVGGGFNRSASFGWEEDGLRGYVFADENNSTVIMGLKGTSPAVFDGLETTTNDKINDNLFFSCCCGQGGQYLWKQVCDCQSQTYTCNQTCLRKELKAENRYYTSSIELYTNLTNLYPNSNIWLTGHSLGGSVSALLGLTFGIPVVAFEAPGDDLPARRLGLPAPPNGDPDRPHARENNGIYHFGHTADPIFMGSCNGATSSCTFGGYALESQCHTGNVCIYDTVSDLGWRVGIGNHKIHVVLDSVIEAYDTVPSCERDSECVDCFNWKYYKDNGTHETTTKSSSTTSTKTRTTTCETPGWWGCLDKTTTTSTESTTTTSTSTSTCKTPGWFGCNDPTTTTEASTASSATPAPSLTITTTPTSSSSTSCKSHGWFGGCKDPTPTGTVEEVLASPPFPITPTPVQTGSWKQGL